MSEAALWHTMRGALGRDGIWERIENKVGRGTADTNYLVKGTEGWVELKHRGAWPAREDTNVALPDFFPWQREWLETRWANGGRVYLMLHIQRARTYLLYHGHTAARIVGLTPQATHEAMAVVKSVGRFPADEVREVLYARSRA